MYRRSLFFTVGSLLTAGCMQSAGGGEIDTDAIERHVHNRVNSNREAEGLSALTHSDKLRQIARKHSEDMAEQGYFSHESPDGQDFEDRYEAAGFECEVEITGSRAVTGGENIGFTYAFAQIERENGETIDHDGDEETIGNGLVRAWMNSSSHRENILKRYWKSEGIGVATATDEEGRTKVLATQNFC